MIFRRLCKYLLPSNLPLAELAAGIPGTVDEVAVEVDFGQMGELEQLKPRGGS